MVKVLIFLTSIDDVNKIDFDSIDFSESKVFSLNFYVHKKLEKDGIKHEIAENYLNEKERATIFDFVIQLHEWYKKKFIFAEMELERVNLLHVLDGIEFQSYIISVLVDFAIIKKIIAKENPDRIITTTSLFSLVHILTKDKKIEVEIYKNKFTQKLQWDEITIKYNIGRLPLSFNISRVNYLKIKNLIERIVGKLFNLSINKSEGKETILLIEFNPEMYSDLLFSLSKYKKNIILLNRRRSAAWSPKSILVLRKSGCKIVDLNKILGTRTRKDIALISKLYTKRLESLWSNDDNFSDIFYFDGYSFWPAIKDFLKNTFKKRISEYIFHVLSFKKTLECFNVRCIVSLNEIGETEKVLLSINKKRIPTILLEHGFANYLPETSRFDFLSGYSLLNDKIAVWGEIQKNYLIKQRNMDVKKILTVGSPRHDAFYKNKSDITISNKKSILIATSPISKITGFADTTLYIKYEQLIMNICNILKKFHDVKIIVKLHPSQVEHTNNLKKLFREIDPSIPVFMLKPIQKLIKSVDAVLTISPFGWDPSSVILESLILEKPTMNIVLDNKLYEFEYVKDNAVLTISNFDDLEKKIYDILYNNELRVCLSNNGKRHVSRYLVNFGTASKNLSFLLNSF